MSEKRALFKSNASTKFYRRDLNNPGKGFKLAAYKREVNARRLAAGINEAYGDDFKVELISIPNE